MARVSEGPVTHARTIVSKRKCVIVFPPAKLLGRCCDAVLLLVSMCSSLLYLVQLLVLAVLPEVILVVILLEHLVEAERVLLSLSLLRSLLLHDVVMLEVVEVRVRKVFFFQV